MVGAYKRKDVSNDFVLSDNEDSRPTKKGKAAASKFEPSAAVKTDDDGNKYWEISGLRRVTISDFKNNSMVSIREYYEKDGKHLPGKKVGHDVCIWNNPYCRPGHQHDRRAVLDSDRITASN